MKRRALLLATTLLALSSYASVSHAADQQTPLPQTQTQGAPAPQGDDHGRPLHRINEEHEGGFEKLQLIFVGAAIVVALGLAYRAGTRRKSS